MSLRYKEMDERILYFEEERKNLEQALKQKE